MNGVVTPARRRLAALAMAVALAAPVARVSVTLAQAAPDGGNPAVVAMADAGPLADAAAKLKAGQYEEALTALQSVKPDGLNAADQKTLTDLTAQAQQATQLRRAARADFEMGQKALDAGDNGTAQTSFKNVTENPYADEGTKAKAAEQAALASAGVKGAATDWKAMYDDAVTDFKAGNYDAAKPKFTTLQSNGYKAPWFAKSPRDYLEQIDKNAAGPGDAEQARAAYLTGRDQYRKGDWIAARQNFSKAQGLGYKPGFFEDEPAKYLARMDKKEQADAALAAKQAMNNAAMAAAPAATPDAATPNAAASTATPTAPAATPAPQLAMADEKPVPATAPAEMRAGTPLVAPAPIPGPAPAMNAPAMNTPATNTPVMTPPAVDTTAPAAPAAPTDDQSKLAANVRQLEAEKANKQYQSKQLVQSAKQAEDAQRYDEARDLYGKAADADPTNADALAGRQRLLTLTGTSPVQEDNGTKLEREVLARRQSVTFSFNLALTQAREQTGRGEFDSAKTSIEQAASAARSDPGLFKNEEIQSFNTQVADARTQLERAIIADRDKKADEARNAASADADQRAKDAEQAKSRAVSSLIADSRRLSEQGRYQDALKVITQILVLDPRNEYATNVRAILFDRASLQGQRENREAFDRNVVLQQNDVTAKEIPYADILTYPTDWPDLSSRRDQTLRDERQVSVADEAVNTLLNKTLPEIRFDQVSFSDVIDFLRDTTQANIFVSWKALEAAGFDRNTPVTLRLRNVKLDKVLKSILKDVSGASTVKLGSTVDEGVITISTTEELATNVVTRTYDIRDLIIQIPDFDKAPTLDLAQSSGGSGGGGKGGGGGGGSSGSLFGGGGGGGGNGQDQNTQTREELVDSITSLIRETIGVGSWKEDGGALGSLRELGGQLIVTQTTEVHRDITDLLQKLREQRSIQVMVEARFLTVQKNFLEDVGIDFDFYFNFDGNPFSNVVPGAALGTTIGSNVTSGLDSATGAAGNVVSGRTAATIDPLTGAAIPASNGTVRTGVAPIGVVNNSANFTKASTLNTGVTGNLSDSFSTPNLATQVNAFLDDFQASLLFRATQGNQNVTQLTAPRLTLFNGQHAYIAVTTDQNYVSDLTPVVGQSAFGFDPTISTLQTGVVLDVIATVSADRKYVTLTLNPQLSRAIGIDSFPVFGQATTASTVVNTGATGTTTGTVPTVNDTQSQFGFIQLPRVQRTRIQTTVSVPDGGTLLLGGTTISGEIEREAGVPVLSKIPFLKRAFTNRSSAQDESILLILVKPTIIIQREIEQQNFPLLTSRPG